MNALRIWFPALEFGRRLNLVASYLLSRDSISHFDEIGAAVTLSNGTWALADRPENADMWLDVLRYDPVRAELISADARNRGIAAGFVHDRDSTNATVLQWGTVFRFSSYGSKLAPHERVIPALCDDPFKTGKRPARRYSKNPTVGFCGFVSTWPNIQAFRLLGASEKAAGLILRRRAIRAVRRDARVDTKFILRRQFWAGALNLKAHRVKNLLSHVGRAPKDVRIPAEFDQRKRNQVYTEFVSNIAESDYTLSPRGAGNFSFRFYQTLAVGRIPVIIDTDLRFPFDAEIDWMRHAVIVPEKRVDDIGEHIIRYHNQFREGEFEARQEENRRLWLEKLQASVVVQRILSDVYTARRRI
jgi:hypothetical protein